MARSVDVRTVDGAVSGTVTLDDRVFGITPNVAVMHQVVTAQLAAARAGTQSTKTRAEVSGGGKKPFRQKGTGRARQGSTRAPHWVGGGVALGPKPRSYAQRTPRKMIQLALRSALSDRASEDRVMVVVDWPWAEPKTADARKSVAALELDGRVLVVLDREIDEVAYKAFRNLPLVQVILAGELNAYDVLCNDWIVFTLETLPGEGADRAELAADADAIEAVVERVIDEVEEEIAEEQAEAAAEEKIGEAVEEALAEPEAQIDAEIAAAGEGADAVTTPEGPAATTAAEEPGDAPPAADEPKKEQP
ncbi:MAG TPA: 50S ribosomal protein L4 [Acidimicrobiales bacterium]|nr:50S ribosomal protein L4 [Acidimicrobiales bacterium]